MKTTYHALIATICSLLAACSNGAFHKKNAEVTFSWSSLSPADTYDEPTLPGMHRPTRPPKTINIRRIKIDEDSKLTPVQEGPAEDLNREESKPERGAIDGETGIASVSF